MKRCLEFLALILSLTLLFTGCSLDESTGSVVENSSSVLSEAPTPVTSLLAPVISTLRVCCHLRTWWPTM